MVFARMLIVLVSLLAPAFAAEQVERNIVYGMYFGGALLMDVYYPASSNGHGIVFIPGSGWHAPFDYSAQELKASGFAKLYVPPLVKAGYTVFVINHRAAPRFKYPAAIEDSQRAVRFVRHHAERFGVRPDRIGGVGGSSGGHLISMLGVTDGTGDGDAPDPVDRRSAKLQAVFARAAPTDLVARAQAPSGSTASFLGARLHPRHTSASPEYKLYWQASPRAHVSPGDPPFLLIHGDNDDRVPFSQSVQFARDLESHGIEARLIRVEGGGHGASFPGAKYPPDYLGAMVQFFDDTLLPAGERPNMEPPAAGPVDDRIEKNVLYGMYSGLALLMDVYRPEKPNGRAILHFTGTGWHSDTGYGTAQQKHSRQVEVFGLPLVAAGYTVFALNNRTAPGFRYPGPLEDAQRGVRFVRHHASRWGIDPEKIGAVGGSSGGHVTAMLATLDGTGDAEDPDPVNRESAKIQCAVPWAPPVDLVRMNGEYGRPAFASLFGMRLMERDAENSLQYKTYWDASPINHVSADDPPVLLIHGDADMGVPFEQSELMREALRKAGVTAELLRVPGGGHGAVFPGMKPGEPDYVAATVEWFHNHLK